MNDCNGCSNIILCQDRQALLVSDYVIVVSFDFMFARGAHIRHTFVFEHYTLLLIAATTYQ